MKERTLFAGVAQGALWVVLAGVVTGTFLTLPFAGSSLRAYVLEQKRSTGNWKALTEIEVASGATIPSGMHAFFTVPATVDRIDRELLLGGRGQTVRYWGYCFPDDDDPENPRQSVGFPGKLFLSERERAWRAAQEALQKNFSPFRLVIPQKQTRSAANPVRHQLERFVGGMTCYIMTEKELPIGSDSDDDELNSKLEQQYGTDPRNPDTDGDGLTDGVEVRGGTEPLTRDTDSDGLIDGLEDKNFNGRMDRGETDPRRLDTDGDGLPDGLARSGKIRTICKDNLASQCVDVPYGMQIGEDKNLNGKVDSGESDPSKIDSLDDGIRDDVRFYKCLLDSKQDC